MKNGKNALGVDCFVNYFILDLQAYRETARLGGWVDLYTHPIYSNSSEEFVVRAPILDGTNGHYRHLMRVRYGSSAIQQPLTHGQFDVATVHGWHRASGYV